MIRKGSRIPNLIRKGTRKVHWLTKGGRTIYLSPEAAYAASQLWLTANVTLHALTTRASDAHWFDLEVTLPPEFDGNPSDGWTDGTIQLGLFRSEDLQSWSAAGAGWDFVPGQETPETIPGGRKKWFARYIPTPVWWEDVMIDVTVAGDRYAKNITAIKLFGAVVSLAYPYTPAEIADGTLETDLVAAGFTGATVDVVAAALSSTVWWFTPNGAFNLPVTMSGANITSVTYQGTTIGTGYPFAMPAQKAALETMLTSALGGGANNRAAVLLHADAWTITLPDRGTTGKLRDFSVTVSPGDPYPGFDWFGNYTGMQPGDGESGSSGNVRSPTGDPMTEAARAFARMGFINIPQI